MFKNILNNSDPDDSIFQELQFITRKKIPTEIPWNNFSEVEIQGILKIYFESAGFEVIWRHVEDPANEKGIDLECIHKIDHKKVLIAVKKKPKVSDLGQVLQLSQHDADQRIYVYINGSAQSVRDQFITFESKVEFWDEKKIETVFENSNLIRWLTVDNSKALHAINSINKNLMDTIKKTSSKPFPKPNKETLKNLWDIKDRAVTLNKCVTFAQLMFEDPAKFGKLSNNQIRYLEIWCLDYLFTYSLLSLEKFFSSLSPDMKGRLFYTYERTKARSNWFNLELIDVEFIPGNIESIAIKKKKNKMNDEPQEKQNQQSTITARDDIFSIDEVADEFRRIGIWADGLEGTIDYLFEECLSEMTVK